MISGIEAQAGRIAGLAVTKLASRAVDARQLQQVRAAARGLIPVQAADVTLQELGLESSAALAAYLESPDFEHLAMHRVNAR